jgi:hypothetical protein
MLRAQASACSPSALSTERPARFLKPKKRGPPIKGSPRDFRRWAWMISGTSLAAEVQSVLRPEILKGMRIPAGDVEALVLDRLRVFFSSRIDCGPLGRRQPDGAHRLPEIAQDRISSVRVKFDPYQDCFNSSCRCISVGRPQRQAKNWIFRQHRWKADIRYAVRLGHEPSRDERCRGCN